MRQTSIRPYPPEDKFTCIMCANTFQSATGFSAHMRGKHKYSTVQARKEIARQGAGEPTTDAPEAPAVPVATIDRELTMILDRLFLELETKRGELQNVKLLEAAIDDITRQIDAVQRARKEIEAGTAPSTMQAKGD